VTPGGHSDMSAPNPSMSQGREGVAPGRTPQLRWALRAIVALLVSGIGFGLWSLYEGISASLHAEIGLHATQMAIEAVEEYVRKHDGGWPRSWKALQESSPKTFDVYQWTGGFDHVNQYVFIDFEADPDRLATQSDDEFEAIKPVGPYYGSYKYHIPFLLQALRETRRAMPQAGNSAKNQ
jgi:hypothetical protein